MIELVKELKRTMKERLVGIEETARLIGRTSRNLYRWLDGEVTPTVKMQGQIRRAIAKMRRQFPTEDEQRKSEAHLETLMTFLPGNLRVKDPDKAAAILGRLGPEDLSEIYVSGQSEENVIRLLKKFRIEVVKK